MSDRATFQPSPLSEEEYEQKLSSDDVMEKFEAIKYDIQEMEILAKKKEKYEKWGYIILLAYLDWFFDKVIELKFPDKVKRKKLQDLFFLDKMKLMRKYGLLIEKNYDDVYLIRDVRNDIAHSLLFNKEEIDARLRKELQNYSTEEFKELHPFHKCIGIVGDIMGIFATAINTHFEYVPTKSQKKN